MKIIKYLPNPRIPFSDCNITFMFAGIKLEANIGIPIPKLAIIQYGKFKEE